MENSPKDQFGRALIEHFFIKAVKQWWQYRNHKTPPIVFCIFFNTLRFLHNIIGE